MKLRLRLRKETAVVEVDEDYTLAELRDVVIKKFSINEFHLSLNGKDALENEEKKLADHDIVSGDLIKILTAEEQPVAVSGPNPQFAQNQTNGDDIQVNQSHNQEDSAEPVASSSTTMSTNADQPQSEAQVEPSSSAMEEISDLPPENEGSNVIQDIVVNRYLEEPMLIRDSTSSRVPQTLELAWRSGNYQSEHQAMVPVLHVLMTEVGFVEKDKPEDHLVYIPYSFDSANSSFKIKYRYSTCNNTFTVMAVPVGPMLVVHGSVSGEKEEMVSQIQLKTADFSPGWQSGDISQVYENLPKVSRLFKDGVAYPLLHIAKQDLEEVQENSLSGILAELKMTIMTFLDVESIMMLGLTCHDMNAISQERVLWRRIFLRDYGRFTTYENDLNIDWQKMYKEKHIQRARYRQAMRNMTMITPPFFNRPVPLCPLPYGPFYPPGAIGGDYDRGPNFGGLPGAIGPFPGSMFPARPRPRFDPHGPVPGQNFRPGRGGGIWEDPGMLNMPNDLGVGPPPGPPARRREGLGSGRMGMGSGFGPRLF